MILCAHQLLIISSFPLWIDIQRMYGKRKAIAKRTPLFPSVSNIKHDGPLKSSTIPSMVSNLPLQSDCYMSTPAITEGDTATDTELETETEIEELLPTTTKANHFLNMKLSKVSRHQPNLSIESTTSSNEHAEFGTPVDSQNISVRPRSTKVGTLESRKILSQHDLFNKYFRRDTVILRHLDLLR